MQIGNQKNPFNIDTPEIDAFARKRVSDIFTLFDSKQLYDNLPLLYDDQQVSGSGTTSTHSSAKASTVMSVTANTAGRRVRQSFMRMNYQPGKSMLIFCTGTISSAGTGAATSLDHICASVMSEGGVQNNGYLRHIDTGSIASLSTGQPYAVMGGRLKTTHLGASIIVENISMIGSANDQAHWELRIGGTVAGTFTYNDIANSAVQVAIGATANTISGGTEIDGGYFTTQQGVSFTVPNALRLGSTIAGVSQEWQLVVIPITNNITVRASVTWRELL